MKAKAINDQLQEIIQFMDQVDVKTDSFLDGNMGISFFYFHLFKIYNEKKYYSKGVNLLEGILGRLESDRLNFQGFGYCDGIIGFSYALNHMVEEKFIDFDLNQVEGIDELIFQWGMSELEKRNTDFLYGPIGAIHYFSEKKLTPTIIHYLTKLINKLDRIAVNANDNERYFHNYSQPFVANGLSTFVSTGVAHGITGIALVLIKIYELSICKELIEKLVGGIINFLLSFKSSVKSKERRSFFPLYIDINNNYINEYIAKIAWCNGDLGVVLLLSRAGKKFKNQSWTVLGDEIAKDVALRREQEKTNIDRLHLCHGSAGVSVFYKSLYEEFRQEQFNESHEYWMNEIVYELDSNKHKYVDMYQNGHSILTGVGGVGLSLASALSPKGMDTWKKAFLL